MATEYLISLLEEAYQKLEEAKRVADELVRDRVIEPRIADLREAPLEIATVLARIPRI